MYGVTVIPQEPRRLLKNMRSTTCANTEHGGMLMTYHDTVVFRSVQRFQKELRVYLDTGGWETVTTKARMTWCFHKARIPASVFTEDGELGVHLIQRELSPEEIEASGKNWEIYKRKYIMFRDARKMTLDIYNKSDGKGWCCDVVERIDAQGRTI